MKKIHHKIYLTVILLTIMSLFVFLRSAQAFRPDTGIEQREFNIFKRAGSRQEIKVLKDKTYLLISDFSQLILCER